MSIQVQSRTLQIQANGTGRLSPDVAAFGDKFSWIVDRRKKKLSLLPLLSNQGDGSTLRAWKAGVRAQSKMIALRSVLSALGLDAVKLRGRVYDVKVKGKSLEVQF
jgi:hypothetical protein